jgi:hypothetical protein
MIAGITPDRRPVVLRNYILEEGDVIEAYTIASGTIANSAVGASVYFWYEPAPLPTLPTGKKRRSTASKR